jgi:hypothetical protein
MPKVIAVHRVSKGTDHWLASPKREEVFGPLGVSDIRTYVNPSDPDHVAVSMNVTDLEAVIGAMSTPEGIAAMEHDGVIADTMVVFIEA